MIANNARILKVSNKAFSASALFSLVMGVLFLGFGLWRHSTVSDALTNFFFAFGLVFLIYGAFRLKRSAMYPRFPEEGADQNDV